MKRETIYTKNAPEPIGPYSQAVRSGNTLYLSGQIAIDPATGEMNQGDIASQTKQVLSNIRAVLNAAGADFKDIVKTTIFVKDMNDFQKVNEIYATCFTTDFPARETVEAARLPKDAKVEISVIARLNPKN